MAKRYLVPLCLAVLLHLLGTLPIQDVHTRRAAPVKIARPVSIGLHLMPAPGAVRTGRPQPHPPPRPVIAESPRDAQPVPKRTRAAAPEETRLKKPNATEAHPDLPKTGSLDATHTVHGDLPMVGDLRGSMEIWAEGEELPYTYYFTTLLQKIASYWEPPPDLGREAGEVAAVLRFLIERDGAVASQYVEEPSGTNSFDTSTLRALQRALPLPPLPQEYPGEALTIHLRFVYTK